MKISITHPDWGGHVMTFNSDDIESYDIHAHTEVVGERNGFEERRITGDQTLTLNFRNRTGVIWESPE